MDTARRFDTLICEELLEHVERPDLLLEQLLRLVEPGGSAYITGAITAAAPDHIYEFQGPEEVLAMARAAGWEVRDHLCAEGRAMTSAAKGPPRVVAMLLSRARPDRP